jgi:hypothetical protein
LEPSKEIRVEEVDVRNKRPPGAGSETNEIIMDEKLKGRQQRHKNRPPPKKRVELAVRDGGGKLKVELAS